MTEKAAAEMIEELLENDSCCNDASCCPTQVPFKRKSEKIGRNDPCPCNSGRKYKKCCA
ncbi:MAG TPA: zinc chelation protein SecC [Gammaproteobacteria bacterium]|nr:zinc chelation protein SecC [Gammaproteobacteria bacterium]